ncbi:hypothetical protein Mettu_1709 [Methylobacter tundripaludum SV96]|uniref:Uncharacterized protein n=1 Tax=Methylobacter tundripaludum (strain ATCC BAA-1195 / DSM 17260 / SV96) TaxID=697282 RepID=G3IVF0_METTV|nr:hypothetical protein Mettu_1709 [Methylobacter tundripaludum SV96]
MLTQEGRIVLQTLLMLCGNERGYYKLPEGIKPVFLQ